MWFVYALLGAFGKSYSGLFRKKLAGNVSASMFLWTTYTIVLLMMLPVIFPRFAHLADAFTHAPLELAGATLSLMLATWLNLEALRREQLSYIAPLNAFVPVFTLVIAWAFLNEHPPASGVFGILIIFIGAYIVNLRSDRLRWYDPLKHLMNSLQNSHPPQTDEQTAEVDNGLKHPSFSLVPVA